MVRLKDVAAQAGVSVMTVSKALRDAPDVSAATKARICALAKELGYVPDSAAQGLRTRSTKLLGLVVSASTNPIFARIILAIEDRAHELGYEVILCHTHNKAEREAACLQRLMARRVDGLLISPVYRLASERPLRR
jgi:LacI family transcriptional regulator